MDLKATKTMFSRFQNLNLLFLREDLLLRRVASGDWMAFVSINDLFVESRIQYPLLCPIAHGWAVHCPQATSISSGCARVDLAREFSSDGDDDIALLESDLEYLLAGVSPSEGNLFINAWDANGDSYEVLLGIIDEIFQERLADADAVQDVICQEAVNARASKAGRMEADARKHIAAI